MTMSKNHRMRSKKYKNVMAIIKASRKKSREEEIRIYGKPINYQKVIPSQKIYNRKKLKENSDDYQS